MDRRKAKTEKAIKTAFGRLIQEKTYGDISIQDIIDEADVARATFYDHFKSKEDVLVSISADIFAHITDEALRAELLREDMSLIFSHTLEEQIGGQLRAGFLLRELLEDTNEAGAFCDYNVPTFILTRAVKP